MRLIPIAHLGQVKIGDALLLSNGREIVCATVEKVKVSEYDGEEVIFDVKRNKFFNIGMYLDGTSWVKDAAIAALSED